jgi:hypothetical protein
MQKGVIRTNCIDCLDRTNVAQQTICLKAIKELTETKDQTWLESFIYAWAMAGDLISRQYSGTESVLTKYTLKGYQNLYDKIEQKMISVKRWKKQNFSDDFKQECILIMQGLCKDVSDDYVR